MREFKVTYTDTDELDEAIESCEKATELEPENPVVWFNMGMLKYDLVEYEEHHHDEIVAGDHHDPNCIELFCDQHPDEPECLIYDD